jgi:acylpyruvate hydrolase
MKLASFVDSFGETRVGAVLQRPRGECLVDAGRVYARYLAEIEKEPRADALAAARVPTDMRLLLEGGERSLNAVRKALDFAAGALRSDLEERWLANGLLHEAGGVRFLPPVPRPGKIISCGANYREHVEETSDFGANAAPRAVRREPPPEPRNDTPPAFAKFASTMIGHNEAIVHSRHTEQLDYEGEFCVVIGTRCKDVPAERYLDPIVGYTIMNDVSMRDLQFRRFDRTRGTGQFDNLLGKNLDTTAPCGPYLVTKDEVDDPQKLQLATYVNGERRQYENTANMVFPISVIIAHYSKMTLEPGDIFTTGNPAGSAMGRKPPERYWLKPGDVVEVEIEKVGRLRNPIVADH